MSILNVENLGYSLPSGNPLFEELSFSLEQSSGLLIYGPTGSGKTTLTKILMGILKDYDGRVEVLGTNMARAGAKRKTYLRRQIGFMMQEPIVLEDLDLIENIRLYLKICNQSVICREIISQLEENGFDNPRGKKIDRLSFGQIRMIEALRIIMKSPELIICDQPFSGLDQDKMIWLAERLLLMVQNGSSIILTYSLPEVKTLLEWPVIRLAG